MHRIWLGIVAAMAATVLAGSAIVADAAPQAAEQAVRSATSDEYVVVYAQGSAFAAEEAIIAAGGTVVDRNAEVDLMLVDTDNAGFAGQVRDALGVTGVALNHSIGTAKPNMPHRFAEERPQAADRGSFRRRARPQRRSAGTGVIRSPPLQWDMTMIGATADGRTGEPQARASTSASWTPASTQATPTSRPNFEPGARGTSPSTCPTSTARASTPTCIDPGERRQRRARHARGRHRRRRADNGFGIAGVAPDATIVNVRAGQDSGYFFLCETVKALVYCRRQAGSTS